MLRDFPSLKSRGGGGGCADRAGKLCLTSVQAAHGAIREPASEAGRWQLDLLPRFLPRKPCLLYHNNLSGGCCLRDFSGLKPTPRQPREGCSLRAAPGDVSADSCPGKNWCSLNSVTTLIFYFLCGHLPADSTCNSPSKRRPTERKRGQRRDALARASQELAAPVTSQSGALGRLGIQALTVGCVKVKKRR